MSNKLIPSFDLNPKIDRQALLVRSRIPKGIKLRKAYNTSRATDLTRKVDFGEGPSSRDASTCNTPIHIRTHSLDLDSGQVAAVANEASGSHATSETIPTPIRHKLSQKLTNNDNEGVESLFKKVIAMTNQLKAKAKRLERLSASQLARWVILESDVTAQIEEFRVLTLDLDAHSTSGGNAKNTRLPSKRPRSSSSSSSDDEDHHGNRPSGPSVGTNNKRRRLSASQFTYSSSPSLLLPEVPLQRPSVLTSLPPAVSPPHNTHRPNVDFSTFLSPTVCSPVYYPCSLTPSRSLFDPPQPPRSPQSSYQQRSSPVILSSHILDPTTSHSPSYHPRSPPPLCSLPPSIHNQHFRPPSPPIPSHQCSHFAPATHSYARPIDHRDDLRDQPLRPSIASPYRVYDPLGQYHPSGHPVGNLNDSSHTTEFNQDVVPDEEHYNRYGQLNNSNPSGVVQRYRSQSRSPRHQDIHPYPSPHHHPRHDSPHQSHTRAPAREEQRAPTSYRRSPSPHGSSPGPTDDWLNSDGRYVLPLPTRSSLSSNDPRMRTTSRFDPPFPSSLLSGGTNDLPTLTSTFRPQSHTPPTFNTAYSYNSGPRPQPARDGSTHPHLAQSHRNHGESDDMMYTRTRTSEEEHPRWISTSDQYRAK